MIKSAVYVGSSVREENCPRENVPEFAFIGRSNVGKSSLINMLCEKKELVKVSNSPGKTRTINFFQINGQFHFVDLPGYGYAKVSQKQRGQFEEMIDDYLVKRKQLQYLFVLIDSRHEPQRLDLNFINHLGEKQVPFVLVFTKADKQGIAITKKHVQLFHDEMMETWESVPQTFITSAEETTGRGEMLSFIHQKISEFNM